MASISNGNVASLVGASKLRCMLVLSCHGTIVHPRFNAIILGVVQDGLNVLVGVAHGVVVVGLLRVWIRRWTRYGFHRRDLIRSAPEDDNNSLEGHVPNCFRAQGMGSGSLNIYGTGLRHDSAYSQHKCRFVNGMRSKMQ